MSQHTPTVTIISKPYSGWTKLAGGEVIESEVTLTIQGQSIHHEDLPAFIVRACNSHAALVEALDDMRRLAASLEDMLEDGQPMDPATQVLADSQHADASAALKLAKEV